MNSDNQQKTIDSLVAASIGRPDFAKRHGLDSTAREEQLAGVLEQIREAQIEVIRFSFIDTHGQVRTRPMEARHFAQAARTACRSRPRCWPWTAATTFSSPSFPPTAALAGPRWAGRATCSRWRIFPPSACCPGPGVRHR